MAFTLHYYAIPGNAEEIRLLCAYAGINLNDHRFQDGEFEVRYGG